MKRARAALVAIAATTAIAGTAPAVAAAAPSPTFTLEHARVLHRVVFFGGRPLALRFRFRSDGPRDVRIRIERRDDRREVWSQVLPAAEPDRTQKVSWDGVTDKGKAAHDGRYRVMVGPADGRLHTAAGFVLHGHVFPVRGRHSERGAIGRFGAPRSGGRRHEGFDIVAACGTPVVAARAGRVSVRKYDPVLDGNFVIVHSLLEDHDYWYVHLRSPSRFKPGDTVRTGQLIGRVGDTGNARTVGCHLHFEVHVGGKPIDPEPELRVWDRWSPGR
jgi:murein DD-endopeptidase MepM/ murein hydrolase activator NlpD